MRNTIIASVCADFGLAAPAADRRVGERPEGQAGERRHLRCRRNGMLVMYRLNGHTQVFKNDDGKLTDSGHKIERGGGAAATRSAVDR